MLTVEDTVDRLAQDYGKGEKVAYPADADRRTRERIGKEFYNATKPFGSSFRPI
jgi:hypothetical protein